MLCRLIITDATTTHSHNFGHISSSDMAPPYSRRMVTSDSRLLACVSCLPVVLCVRSTQKQHSKSIER
jgi:hypothetical protein